MKEICLSKRALSEIAGYTYRWMHNIDLGLPTEGKLFVKGDNGQYQLSLFVQRWAKYNAEQNTVEDKSLEEVKAIHERIKTRKTELEVERLEGKLVDVAEIKKLWATIARTVTQNMMRIPNQIAPRLQMLDNVEVISAMIADEIRNALEAVSETPLPEYVAADDETEEGEDEEEA